MASQGPPEFDGEMLAPGGRQGHARGWRWAFPYGTMPIPWHPRMRALPWLALAAFAALIGFALFADAGWLWTAPLWAALLLAVPLSIPFGQLFAFFLRVPLLQAAMAPLAMLMLAIAVARGQQPPAMAAIPVGFFGVHLLLAVGGRRALRRFRRTAEAVAADPPFAGTHRLLRLVGTRGPGAIRLLDRHRLDAIETSGEDSAVWRISRLALAAMPDVVELVKAIGDPAIGIARKPRDGEVLIRTPADVAPAERLFVRGARVPPLLLGGRLDRLRAWTGDGKALDYVHGSAAPFDWFPGWLFFFKLVLDSGGGRMARVIGFVRAGARHVGAENSDQAYAALFGSEPPVGAVDPEAIRALLVRKAAERADVERASFAALLADPGAWRHEELRLLALRPALFAGRDDALCDAFERAREARAELALPAIARLLARLPQDRFAALGTRLIGLLDSREVALHRPVRVVVTKAEFRAGITPPVPFGGFGLLRLVPELYARLGELGEPARRLIETLGTLADWPKALQDAKSRLG